MHIFCDTCNEKCSTFLGWMEHLLCRQHHQNTSNSIPQWTTDMNERAIIVNDIKDFSPEDTAWYFASEGLMADFYYYQTKKYKLIYVIQYDSRETAEKCVEKVHIIEGLKVTPKWKTEFDSAETYSYEKRKVINNVMSLLKRYEFHMDKRHSNNPQYLFSTITPIRHARVPIIKLVHYRTGIKCDLSFENLLSVQNSKMIDFYCSLDRRVYPLLHLIRYWGRYHDITGSVQIKNYGLILLVLTFLQKKRIIPSVAFLQTGIPENKKILIEGWNASFNNNEAAVLAAFNNSSAIIQHCYLGEKIPLLANEDGTATTRVVLKLAYEFFNMYSTLDFETMVVYPLTGTFISKRKFANEENLPDELSVYRSWLQNHDSNNVLRLDTPLCVIDPFSLNFNVGSCASSLIVYKFQKACKETAERLNEMLSIDNVEANLCLTQMFAPVLTTEYNNGSNNITEILKGILQR